MSTGLPDWYSWVYAFKSMNFLQLDDTPSTYVGQALKHVRVKVGEAALEFADLDHTHQTPGAEGGKIDHGAALTGLGDDDHPQYLMASKVYPIGAIYISTLAANPGTYIGFGTWVAFGAGKVLVGLDPLDPYFDTVEETGGEPSHVLTGGEMPIHSHKVNPPATGSGGDTVTHGHPFTTGGRSVDHTHQIPARKGSSVGGVLAAENGPYLLDNWGNVITSGGESADHVHSGGTDVPGNAHGHIVDIAEFDSGVQGAGYAHNNFQPYIVVYMWKRTA